MNFLIVIALISFALAESNWEQNYDGANYVVATAIIFSSIFVVFIGLSILFAVVVTVKEYIIKRKEKSEDSSEVKPEEKNEIV
ncbi:Single tm domain protein [Entamoeba marina]